MVGFTMISRIQLKEGKTPGNWETVTATITGWGHPSDITKIDGGHIYTDTITAAQLVKTAAVITETAQIGNGVIENANIHDAAITYAKIGTAEVKTLTIDGHAVTAAQGTSADSAVNITDKCGVTWTDLLTYTFTPVGDTIILVGGCGLTTWDDPSFYGYYVSVRMIVEGTQVWKSANQYATSNVAGSSSVTVLPDNSCTIKLQGCISDSNLTSAQASYRFLTVLECKR